ncbi:MAG: AmmeMemoRadiSam system protein B [Chloroherpetonaceae bacterium]
MYDGKIPKLRSDIDVQIIEENGTKGIVLYDKRGFAQSPIMVSTEFFLLLELLEEGLSEDELRTMFFREGAEIDISPILENLKVLDEYYFLESPLYFEKLNEDIATYQQIPARPLLTVGRSYPEDLQEFQEFMQHLSNSKRINNSRKDADAIIVPHIDLSLVEYSHPIYAAGYDAIADKDFDTIVIFGTSHYVFSDYFMLTKKPYRTPFGVMENDNEVIDYLVQNFGNTFSFDDQAHRFEHTIEYQAVLSSYFFKNRKIKIIPILVGPFQKFVYENVDPISDPKISTFIKGLTESLQKLNRKPVFIASVDFSHIGIKFGDEFNANEKLDECKQEDFKLIQAIEAMDKKAFFDNIISTKDAWKVCGVSPIYSLLAAVQVGTGYFLDYNQWYEEATKSAVSFASLAFWK